MLAAKKKKAVTKPVIKAVTATTAMIETVSSDDDIDVAAAVLPDSLCEYNLDSDEDWDVSHCEVSPQIRSEHLIWNCQIHGLIDDFPVRTRALIDNGAHLILIRPELIEQLGLKTYKLNKPEFVDVTFNNQKRSKTKLYNYVKLSLISLDCTWTSRSVKALITPGLCVPIILRLPWLEHNVIVIDHTAHTCIDKINSYDLLNPPPVLPPLPPKPKLCKQIKLTKADKKLVLTELMMVCNDRLQHLKLKPKKVMEFNVVGAVCKHIEVLAAQEILIM